MTQHDSTSPWWRGEEAERHAGLMSSYKTLAPFYSTVFGGLKYFDNEYLVLRDILARYSIGRGAAILDAAMGTGVVLERLRDDGFGVLLGLDASQEMMQECDQGDAKCGAPRAQCRWQDFGTRFQEWRAGGFATIFLLGNALHHAAANEVPAIFRSLRKGMLPGGLMIFDMRMWGLDSSGMRVQPGRAVGVWRPMFPATPPVDCEARYTNLVYRVAGRDYWIDERCSYEPDLQIIEYRLRRVSENGLGWDHEQNATVVYTTFNTSDVQTWLEESGFGSVEFLKFDNWSHLAVVAIAE